MYHKKLILRCDKIFIVTEFVFYECVKKNKKNGESAQSADSPSIKQVIYILFTILYPMVD